MTTKRTELKTFNNPNQLRFLIAGFIVFFILIFTSCESTERIVRDHTQKATSTHRKRPSGEGSRISFTGYLYDTEDTTTIIVYSLGDVVAFYQTTEQTYTLSLQPRTVQRVDFINDGRLKTMMFINFTEVSERETFDVFFRNPDSVTFIKKRPRDDEWFVIYWRATQSKVKF